MNRVDYHMQRAWDTGNIRELIRAVWLMSNEVSEKLTPEYENWWLRRGQHENQLPKSSPEG